MGWSSTTVKHILLLVNFVLAVSGIFGVFSDHLDKKAILLLMKKVLGLLLLGSGIFILVSAGETNVDHGENVAGGLVITLGLVSIAIAIFGSFAAMHESNGRLIIYIITLVVLILLELIMCSMASMGTKDGLSGSVHKGFEELWEYELKEPGALAFYEDWLHCCGVNNTADYHNIQHPIPISCCIKHNCSLTENIYSIGCEEKFEEYLYDKFLTFTIVAYILIILEVII